ncbi:G-patch domain and KOW motifs-containing protein [Vanessa atalanta]|uniref:G-patch domain and KOW motifs-containing protein n=1 Tax=Vanessa atalanta TaxID=42275 RepID=UPI001FCDC365|nr:G-patch domain and KOW motifs-containing protein [Vanessa atalanta]
MEGKKISFGFMKTKKDNKPLITEKKEYIECVEEKSIKVVGGEVKEEDKPLVIPMKPNTLITAERLREIAEKAEDFEELETKITSDDKNLPNEETIDQMAVRELMEEAKKEKVLETPQLVLPMNAKPVIEGQIESTLDDYDSVPVQEFGLAMLRGMGWTPSKDQSKYKQPQLRPKGLGLGADKVIKENQKKKSSNGKDEDLSIVKNSFVKITSGKYSGFYAKVLSLDEENGRVMVEISVKKETVSLSEFMMQAVSKSEFDKQSKVINVESYEEYKKKESYKHNNSKVEDVRKDGSSSKNSNDIRVRDSSKIERREEERPRRNEQKHSNGRSRKSASRERYRKESSSSEEDRSRHKIKNKKKYSSNESLTSESDNRHKSVTRRRHSSSDSSEINYRKEKSKKHKSTKEKRDIDKKRKGKKKKRDRDRSPNYKKCRK